MHVALSRKREGLKLAARPLGRCASWMRPAALPVTGRPIAAWKFAEDLLCAPGELAKTEPAYEALVEEAYLHIRRDHDLSNS
jgi:hypothetical protein